MLPILWCGKAKRRNPAPAEPEHGRASLNWAPRGRWQVSQAIWEAAATTETSRGRGYDQVDSVGSSKPGATGLGVNYFPACFAPRGEHNDRTKSVAAGTISGPARGSASAGRPLRASSARPT